MNVVSAALLMAAFGLGTIASADSPSPSSPWRKVTVRVYPKKPNPEAQLEAACDVAGLLSDELKTGHISARAKSDLKTLRDLVCRNPN
jgi:hypothetical protein